MRADRPNLRAGGADDVQPYLRLLPDFAGHGAVASGSVLGLGWAGLGWAGRSGLGIGIGLYEGALATLAGIYARAVRGPMTGITLNAGFASTVGWLLSGLMLATWVWREA